MKIEFRNESSFGQNTIVDLYINETIVGTLRLRPIELRNLVALLVRGSGQTAVPIAVISQGKVIPIYPEPEIELILDQR